MSNLPSVSAILPCGYGDKYVGLAVQCFVNQTYQGPLQLVIVDNNTDDFEVEVEIPDDLNDRLAVEYVRCERMSVGALRNLGTSHAIGEVCITWDEDDWYHPDRIAAQVKRLQESGKAVTGWHNINFYDMATDRTYKYFYEPTNHSHAPYACGTSQAYLRSWWEKHKFSETGVEDWPFTQAARDAGQLDSCDAGNLAVARAHKDSKCPPLFGHKQFPEVPRDSFPPEFFAAIGEKQQETPPMAE
jgi:glycosyltransferase involved in cell wall biosynthesis